jgi:hypothetical protein
MTNLRVFSIFLFVASILGSCSKSSIPQLNHNNINKRLRNSDEFEFRSINSPITYKLNDDSIRAYQKRKISFCRLIERDLGYIQGFFSNNFDFPNDKPIEKKSSFCGFDTCKSDYNCGYSLTCFSDFSIDRQAFEAKKLPRLLFISDKYFNTGTNYGLMFRIDFSIVVKYENYMTISELDISTKFILRQRSKDDTEGWEKIDQTKQIDDIKYLQFISEYNLELNKYLEIILFSKGYMNKVK